jgi:hypothetical protein
VSTQLLLPTTRYVAAGWLQLAVPGVGAGVELPELDDDLRANGFMRTTTAGGSPRVYVEMRQPIVQVECWFPPPRSGKTANPSSAEQLANQVLRATYDQALMGQLIDLAALTGGEYAAARVHTVIALSEPDQVDDVDLSDWARFDLDLQIRWTPEATGA